MQLLTNEQMLEVYGLYDNGNGVSQSELGKRYNVSPRTIRRAIEKVRSGKVSGTVPEVKAPVTKPETKTKEPSTKPKAEKATGEDTFYTFVLTRDSISVSKTVSKDGDEEAVESNVITNDDSSFKSIFEMIMKDGGSQKSLEKAFVQMSKKLVIEKASFGRIKVDPEAYKVSITTDSGTRDVSGVLATRILESLKEEGVDGRNLARFVKFTENLYLNHSFRAVNELFRFLEAADIKITEDGLVECYKRVRGDFKDYHSATFDNSVGKVVKVERNMVDEDSNQTCSYGLHVCSRSYLGDFYNGGGKVVKVLVHPKDFVAVPQDYNNAKARVCEYKVASLCDKVSY